MKMLSHLLIFLRRTLLLFLVRSLWALRLDHAFPLQSNCNVTSVWIVGKGFPTFYFLKTPPYFLSPPHFFPKPQFFLLHCFFGWMRDCAISSVLVYFMISTCYVFYAARREIYCRFGTDSMAFSSFLILYETQINTPTAHKGTNRLIYKIYWHNLLCPHSRSHISAN